MSAMTTSKTAAAAAAAAVLPRRDETPLKASTAYDVLVIIGWLGYGERDELGSSDQRRLPFSKRGSRPAGK